MRWLAELGTAGAEDRFDAAAEHFVLGVAEHLGRAGRPIDDDAGEIGENHGVRHLLEDQRLAPQRRLARLQLGDVGGDRDGAAVLGALLGGPQPTPVVELDLLGAVGSLVTLDAFLNPGLGAHVLNDDPAALGVGAAQRLVTCAAADFGSRAGEHRPVLVVGQHQAVPGVEQDEPLGDALDGVDQLGLRPRRPRLAHPQGLLGATALADVGGGAAARDHPPVEVEHRGS